MVNLRCPCQPIPDDWGDWDRVHALIDNTLSPERVPYRALTQQTVLSAQHVRMALRPSPSQRIWWIFWTTTGGKRVIVAIPYASLTVGSRHQGASWVYNVWDDTLWKGDGTIFDVESTAEGQWLVDCYRFCGELTGRLDLLQKKRMVRLAQLHRDTVFKSHIAWIPSVPAQKVSSLSVKRYSFEGVMALPLFSGVRWIIRDQDSPSTEKDRTAVLPS